MSAIAIAFGAFDPHWPRLDQALFVDCDGAEGAGLLDGEIVVEDAAGLPSFSLLQADLSTGRGDRLRHFVFDLLYCEGFDLTKVTLLDRKELLHQVLARLGSLTITFHYRAQSQGRGQRPPEMSG